MIAFIFSFIEQWEICQEPANPGDCEGYYPKYFFNVTSGQCESFIYGGCGGNNNRFESPEECQSRCRGTAIFILYTLHLKCTAHSHRGLSPWPSGLVHESLVASCHCTAGAVTVSTYSFVFASNSSGHASLVFRNNLRLRVLRNSHKHLLCSKFTPILTHT